MYSLYEYNKAGHMKVIKDEALEQGRIEGINDLNALNLWLFDCGRTDDVRKAASDPKYLEKLFDEYSSCKRNT